MGNICIFGRMDQGLDIRDMEEGFDGGKIEDV